jgi:hypothetical protein
MHAFQHYASLPCVVSMFLHVLAMTLSTPGNVKTLNTRVYFVDPTR